MKIASDKGHKQEIIEFAQAILKKGPQPIPLWQQFQAMEIAFEVERLLLKKGLLFNIGLNNKHPFHFILFN